MALKEIDLGNVRGPQGPKGDRGEQGPAGEKGATGAAGPNTVSTITTTTGFTNGHFLYNNNGKVAAKAITPSMIGAGNRVTLWSGSISRNDTLINLSDDITKYYDIEVEHYIVDGLGAKYYFVSRIGTLETNKSSDFTGMTQDYASDRSNIYLTSLALLKVTNTQLKVSDCRYGRVSEGGSGSTVWITSSSQGAITKITGIKK